MSRSSFLERWPLLLAILSLSLSAHLRPADAVECYICGWSPSNGSRPDVCTRTNFSANVTTHSCVHGCESVAIYDKNGKMEFFYRNCAEQSGNDHHHQSGCRNETNKAFTKEICTCHANYCNHATPNGLHPTLLTALFFLPLVLKW